MNIIFHVLLLIPAFSILTVLVEQIWNYFKKPNPVKHQALEPNKSRLRALTDPILDKIPLNKSFWICHDPNDPDTQAKSNFWQSAIFIADFELALPDHQLQSIIAHEIVHLRMGDPFKLIIIEAINYCLIIYSVILSLMILLITPSLKTFCLVALLALIVWFLCLWSERIAENTADGGAAIMGYGPGLIEFFETIVSELTLIQRFLDPHESFEKRILQVSKIINESH